MIEPYSINKSLNEQYNILWCHTVFKQVGSLNTLQFRFKKPNILVALFHISVICSLNVEF